MSAAQPPRAHVAPAGAALPPAQDPRVFACAGAVGSPARPTLPARQIPPIRICVDVLRAPPHTHPRPVGTQIPGADRIHRAEPSSRCPPDSATRSSTRRTVAGPLDVTVGAMRSISSQQRPHQRAHAPLHRSPTALRQSKAYSPLAMPLRSGRKEIDMPMDFAQTCAGRR